jgi:phosphoadenosine phosphosulfate reductase
MKKHDIADYQAPFELLSAMDVLKKAIELVGIDMLALASSLAVEDQVLTHMLLSIQPAARIFTLDTGRLPQETYDTMTITMKHYTFHYEILFPEHEKIEAMIAANGPNLFYENRDQRALCCYIRKVAPLERKLKTLNGWICGLRRTQSVTRSDIKKIEWDEAHGLVKINPLADWTQEQVWDYIRAHHIPYNALHDKGYASIGCAPCTRPIAAGDDIRAGRWWWETPEHKECGLHHRRAHPPKQDA